MDIDTKAMRHQMGFYLKALDDTASKNTVVASAEVPASDERQGDIVKVAGMTPAESVPLLAGHKQNAENGRSLVIGRAANWRTAEILWRGTSVAAKLVDIEFHDHTDIAKEHKAMFDDGWLNAVSIGFRPKAGKINRIKTGYEFGETEIIELSVVAIPANPAAVVCRAFGMADDAMDAAAKEEIELPTEQEIKQLTKLRDLLIQLDPQRIEKAITLLEEVESFGVVAQGAAPHNAQKAADPIALKQVEKELEAALALLRTK